MKKINRQCRKLKVSSDGKRAIFIDEENKEKILSFILKDEKRKKKFNYIINVILEGSRNPEIYDKEEIDKSCKGVTAMKLLKGSQNIRIYCKELTTAEGVFVVVAGELLEKKKNQKNKHTEKNLIKKVASYEYEIISEV